MSYIEWSCPDCGAKGTIDPANDICTAIKGVQRGHAILSPNCPSVREGDLIYGGPGVELNQIFEAYGLGPTRES